jgi:hypothetical protein
LYTVYVTTGNGYSDRYISEWLQEERDNEVASGKDNDASSGREMARKNITAENTIHISGFWIHRY